jgi:hypothetical protein
VSFRLRIPKPLRERIAGFGLPREDWLHLYIRLRDVLPAAADNSSTWVHRRHAQFPDSFFWNVVFRSQAGRAVRFYCVCQKETGDVIVLRVIHPVRL